MLLLSKYQIIIIGTGDMSVSMGLVDPDDILLTEWNASIVGPQGN
jgi:hypothetical protein